MGSLTARVKRLRKKAVLALRPKDPGLKPLESIGFIQGAEAPCSLRNAKMEVFPQPVNRALKESKTNTEILGFAQNDEQQALRTDLSG
jgi:hypothetical protein